MNEKDMARICIHLKTLTKRSILFHDIKIELLDVMRASHQPNTAFSRHHHPWFEFNYFSDGMFQTEMCGCDFVCKKGQALLIPPGKDHAQKSGPEGDDGVCMRWQISATKNEISEESMRFLEEINHPHPEALQVDMSILLALDKDAFLNDSVFLHFVLSIYARWLDKTEKSKPSQLISHQAILYMEEYLKNRITIADVARALNLSYRTLSRVFKKETGVSMTEKLSELRMNKACKLLIETKLSISKIAEETGFENIHYFSAAFKKQARLSPKQFRALRKKESANDAPA